MQSPQITRWVCPSVDFTYGTSQSRVAYEVVLGMVEFRDWIETLGRAPEARNYAVELVKEPDLDGIKALTHLSMGGAHISLGRQNFELTGLPILWHGLF